MRDAPLSLQIRNDAYWPISPPLPSTLPSDAVSAKSCLGFGGLNDKFAFIPRRYASTWMDLLLHYYDPSYVDYANIEELVGLIAKRRRVKVTIK